MDTAWIALIGTVFGGAGLKIIENILSKGQDKVDTATAMRQELRSESIQLKDEIRQVEKELDQWKEKYFLLLQQYLEAKADHDQVHPKKKEPDKPEW